MMMMIVPCHGGLLGLVVFAQPRRIKFYWGSSGGVGGGEMEWIVGVGGW